MIPTIRDISIIFLALESIVVLVLLSILIVQIRNLVILLNEEIKPMLAATNETASTVRNTTTFVSTRVASPFIHAMSFVAGVRQAAKTMKQDVFPSGKNSGPTEAPPSAPDTPAPADTPVTPDSSPPITDTDDG